MKVMKEHNGPIIRFYQSKHDLYDVVKTLFQMNRGLMVTVQSKYVTTLK
jgi:hypothetical protein